MGRPGKTYQYRNWDDDVIFTKHQEASIPPGFIWLHTNLIYRFASTIVYGLCIGFATIYCRLFLHVTFRNKRCLRTQGKKGAFIFANHTQPLGDVFIPMLAALPRRAYTVAEAANLGIPIVGKMLTMGGALILPAKLSQMIQFQRAMTVRLKQHQRVFIYPEAHVWPYYTGIRPFPNGAFHYPVSANVASYAMTATYQQRRGFTKPRMIIYFDGPFYPDLTLPRKVRQEKLHDEVRQAMVVRSRQSNVQYAKYQRRPDASQ